MKKLLQQKLLLALAAAVILSACNDPVFDYISREVPPEPPLIPGTPTNMVVFNNNIYVASGAFLWRYAGTRWPRWQGGPTSRDRAPIPQPGGRIIQLAATNNFLYALTFEDSRDRVTFTLRRFDGARWVIDDDDTWIIATDKEALEATKWPPITVAGTIRNIHAVHNALFINTEVSETNRTAHQIFYIYEDQGNPENTPLTAVNLEFNGENAEGEISGVAWNGTYYFIPVSYTERIDDTTSRRSGVFVVNSSAAVVRLISDPVFDPDENKRPDRPAAGRFMGIIHLENAANTILVIARNGELFEVTDNDFSRIEGVSMGNHWATGALAIWREDADASPSLLLAGRQSRAALSQGYVEIEIDANGIVMAPPVGEDPPRAAHNFREPLGREISGNISSVHDRLRYTSTIGRHVVNHIFQAPSDITPNMTLFASTQLNGLWSYRQRNYIWQWNAEN